MISFELMMTCYYGTADCASLSALQDGLSQVVEVIERLVASPICFLDARRRHQVAVAAADSSRWRTRAGERATSDEGGRRSTACRGRRRRGCCC